MSFQQQGIQLAPKPGPKAQKVIQIHVINMLIQNVDSSMKL